MAREGQTKVEVRPGAFIWMDDNDRKAFEQRQAGQAEAPVSMPRSAPETTSVEPGENASQPPAKAKK